MMSQMLRVRPLAAVSMRRTPFGSSRPYTFRPHDNTLKVPPLAWETDKASGGGHGHQARSSIRAMSSSRKRKEMCVIVDEHNRVVGSQPRDITVSQRLLGRGAYVLVLNDKGDELLVSKRTMNKDVYPGYLDVVISGVCTEGEEYEDTALRELQEELGLSPEQADQTRGTLHKVCIFPYKDSYCHVFGAAFTYRLQGAGGMKEGTRLKLQEEEVEWAKWVPLAHLPGMMADGRNRFTPVGQRVLELYQESLK